MYQHLRRYFKVIQDQMLESSQLWC